MGTGIGIVAARTAGINVKFVDAFEPSLKRSEEFVKSWIDKEIQKQRMTEQDKATMLGRISYHDNVSKLNDVDFAVEAANEDFVLKSRIFDDLAKHTPKHAILASNTSSISISKIAGQVKDRAH